ncbi:MAG: DUF485 domain-containing protein [Armatimonadia bacterium]|nr:DUF485 domain-containing protein [Armatimonadia bacterium]
MTYEEMLAKQLKLSVFLAVIFLVTMFSVPLLNYFATEAMLQPVLGIPFVWLFVGVCFHVEFWILAVIYTRASNRWEEMVEDDG